MLVAEYDAVTRKLAFVTSDQVRSTCIVTDEFGNVVYSAQHDPYGGILFENNNGYSPRLKFSGKEREKESQLDYFGARYYDNRSFRFLSVDPIINKDEALVNPQLWNLYSYCDNNPVNRFDPNGQYSKPIRVPGYNNWYYRWDPPHYDQASGKMLDQGHYQFMKKQGGQMIETDWRVYENEGKGGGRWKMVKHSAKKDPVKLPEKVVEAVLGPKKLSGLAISDSMSNEEIHSRMQMSSIFGPSLTNILSSPSLSPIVTASPLSVQSFSLQITVPILRLVLPFI